MEKQLKRTISAEALRFLPSVAFSPEISWKKPELVAKYEAFIAQEIHKKAPVKNKRESWNDLFEKKKAGALGGSNYHDRRADADQRRREIAETDDDFTADHVAKKYGIAISTARKDLGIMYNSGLLYRRPLKHGASIIYIYRGRK